MPAPPSDLVNALRAGTVARHVFFTLTHVDGDVRCWDGIGDFPLSGNTFKGVGGMMRVEGVSDSGDVQNHQVAVTLNGVALSSVNLVTLSIRNEAASLVFAWIAEDGSVVASRTVFSGLGDTLRTKFTADESSVTAILRAPLAEWRTPPRAYYTDQDQQRRFTGDTGFSLVSQLENVSVSGWSKNPESSGAVPTLALAGGYFFNNANGEIIGAEIWGPTAFCYNSTPPTVRCVGGTVCVEDTTGAAAGASARAIGGTMQVGGVNCYIDLDRIVRTAGGQKVIPTGNAGKYLREQQRIAVPGDPTGSTLTAFSGGGHTFFKVTGTSQAYPADDLSKLVYDNAGLANVFGDSGTTSGTVKTAVGGTAWVEEGTGNAVTYSGGLMKCNGADCVVSSTAAIITNTGKKIVLSGSSDAKQFLRVWQ